MTISVSLLLASIAAALAAWRVDRIKDGHHQRIRSSIRLRWGFSIIVIFLAFANQYITYQQSGEQRAAQLRISVLQSLANYRDDLLMGHAILSKNSEVTTSFVNFEAGRSSSPSAALAIPPWEDRVSESWRQQLRESRTAFVRLQKIAREVLLQATTYPEVVPEIAVSWANETLALRFSDVPKLTNDSSIEAQQYGFRTGQVIGVITGKLRSETMGLTK